MTIVPVIAAMMLRIHAATDSTWVLVNNIQG